MAYAPKTVIDCSTGQVTQVALTSQEIAVRDADATARAAVLTAQATLDANGATLRSRASAALTANSTFLAIASPSNAQVLAQVQRLTKECNAIIRLLTNALDAVTDT